jgi:hypothetical protein
MDAILTRRFDSADFEQLAAQAALFENDPAPLAEKVEGFAKYSSYRTLGKFLTRYELFKRVLEIPGAVAECGVFMGQGLMTWAKLSSLLEPNHHTRRVIGFDTFDGFPSIAEADRKSSRADIINPGALKGSSLENVREAVRVYDMKRPIPHCPKVELISGDMATAIPRYVADNPHLVVALLNLDADLYTPTKIALEHFVPRMPKGAIIVFDELYDAGHPGETRAVIEELGLGNLRIRQFLAESVITYAVIGE